MKKTSKHYSAEEKAKIVIEVLKSEYTMAELSSKYGVHANQLQRWKQGALEAISDKFKRKPKEKDDSQEELIKTLYEQIGQLTVEKDWLKKKSTLFTN
ncbi:MAG: transposase [Rickettsiaceae bacterium]|nr:transposase [Rickettsiaceae bacterium]